MERQQFDSSRVAGKGVEAPAPPQEETPGTAATPSDFATSALGDDDGEGIHEPTEVESPESLESRDPFSLSPTSTDFVGSSDVPEQNRPVGSQPDESCGSSQDEILAAGSRRQALERRLVVLSRVLPILRRLQARATGKEEERKQANM